MKKSKRLPIELEYEGTLLCRIQVHDYFLTLAGKDIGDPKNWEDFARAEARREKMKRYPVPDNFSQHL